MGTVNVMQWSGILVDAVIISLLAGHMFWGYRKGLVNIMFNILSFVVALIIMFVLYKPVANFIMQNTNWDESLTQSISNTLSGVQIVDGQLIKPEQTNISQSLVEQINQYAQTAIEEGKANIIDYVSERIAVMMIYTGTMIGLFIIARLLLFLVRFVAELIADLPFIRSINKSGGLVCGTLKGAIIIYFLLAVISIASPLLSQLGIITAISKSHIGSILYNNNILLNIFSNSLKNF